MLATDVSQVRHALMAASTLDWHVLGEEQRVIHETAGLPDFVVAECSTPEIAQFFAHTNHMVRYLGLQAQSLLALIDHGDSGLSVAAVRDHVRVVSPDTSSPWLTSGVDAQGRQVVTHTDAAEWAWRGKVYHERQRRTEFKIAQLLSTAQPSHWEIAPLHAGESGFRIVDGATRSTVAWGSRPADGALVVLAGRVLPRLLEVVRAVEDLSEMKESAGESTIATSLLAETINDAAQLRDAEK